MTSQDSDARRILSEAKRLCELQGEDVTITLIGGEREHFVIIFNVGSFSAKSPSERDVAIETLASQLHAIRGVARVCYEILPNKRQSQ